MSVLTSLEGSALRLALSLVARAPQGCAGVGERQPGAPVPLHPGPRLLYAPVARLRVLAPV